MSFIETQNLQKRSPNIKRKSAENYFGKSKLTSSQEAQNAGAFKLYDVDNDGFITRDEMYNIVDAIYQMLGNQTKESEQEESPQERVDKIFDQLDKNHDNRLTLEEFREGSKQDPKIVQALSLYAP
ncbi:hypothetical protein HPB47_001578 [Ixodes persulcatus]|uniref:Uncharacterized protein n=1 Tax=Ixodes persulcatus TaxID=34615 RepID=A0AC60PNR8_IXOPE|nr:hypothetical protein HPB47_001578 [Ixodes persulcatus]